MSKAHERKVREIEQLAKDRFIENSDWDAVLEMLDTDEKDELNETYKKAYGTNYPNLRR